MKMVIEGREYPLTGLNEASLSDLMALKQQTGLGMKALQAGLADLSTGGEDALDQGDALIALAALVWLTRRKAGEKLTFEEANAFPLTTLEMVAEDGDEVPEADAPVVPDPPLASSPDEVEGVAV